MPILILLLIHFTLNTQAQVDNSKCMDKEFQAEFLIRNGCRQGQIQSCEILSAAEETKKYNLAAMAFAFGGLWSAIDIFRASDSLETNTTASFYQRKLFIDQLASLSEKIEKLSKMEPNKAGFNTDDVDSLKKQISTQIEAIEKIYSKMQSEAELKSGTNKTFAKSKLSIIKMEYYKGLETVIEQNKKSATPYGKTQLDAITSSFNKIDPDLKNHVNNYKAANKSGEIRTKTRWLVPLGLGAGATLNLGFPLLQAKTLQATAKNYNINLDFNNAHTLREAISIPPAGSVSVSIDQMSKMFDQPERWKKILDESPGLCNFLVKQNEENKKLFSADEALDIKCGVSTVSWDTKTRRGAQRFSIERKENGKVFFYSSKYYLEVFESSTGEIKLGLPMTLNNIQLPIGDLKTDQLANFYSQNLTLCQKEKTGVENENRCTVGEEIIKNFQVLPKALKSCQKETVKTKSPSESTVLTTTPADGQK